MLSIVLEKENEMSYKGTLYFFMCHALYTVMQMRYEIQEVTLTWSTEQLNNKWNTPYHTIIGWTLEEIVFPLTLEQIVQTEGKTAGEFAEIESEALYSYMYNALLTSAKKSQDICGIPSDRLLHYQYCSFLRAILNEYEHIAIHRLEATPYILHYQQNIDTFATLARLLEEEFTNIDANCLTKIEAKSDELRAQWSNRLYSAVDNYRDSTTNVK